jgi:hypothetical protein
VFWTHVKTKYCTYKVPRRFSEFYSLNCHLKGNQGIEFKDFPSRSWLKITSEAKLTKRMEQLDSFMKFVVD